MAWCMNLPAKRGGLARSLKFLPASILNGTAVEDEFASSRHPVKIKLDGMKTN
jgi:hypothetical protein